MSNQNSNQKPLYLVMGAGSGTRLFPMSLPNAPKQFIKLENEYSLIQNTILRLPRSGDLVITTMEKYLDILKKQLAELKLNCEYTVVVVPETYNTAYSICVVSMLFEGRNIIAIPSDKIFDQTEFSSLMDLANDKLNKSGERILFIGKIPTYPATGFGYLECADDRVVRFVEKPCEQKAFEYIKSGKYYWNCGILGFSTNTLNKKYLEHRKDIVKMCEKALSNAVITSEGSNIGIIKLSKEGQIYGNGVEDVSIDYAINEKLKEGEMSFIPFNGKLLDVGSWNSIHDMLDKNENNINKTDKCKSYKSENCLVMTKKPIYINGIKNLVIIETDECIMISDINKTQDVKTLVNL
jgi:mannose-1-phosphate guanylyltransferase